MSYYILTSDGRTVLALKNDDKNDKIYAVNNSGELTGKSLEISTDFMHSKETFAVNTKRDGPQTIDVYSTNDKSAATSFFKFAAQNTNVEWSQTNTHDLNYNPDYGFDNNMSFIGTTHQQGFDVSSSFIANSKNNGLMKRPNHMTNSTYLDECIHSHDNGSLRASDADVNFAEKVSNRYVTARFFTYSFITNGYLEYSRYSEKGIHSLGEVTIPGIHKKKK